ncbi:MAG TPA: class I SAM-dependent methyltransferase, partial [Pyrinomonadaceae bacterium]|nr:class I SAM-dependent methyltransferase [Pyrinomonadaceae bacterium]
MNDAAVEYVGKDLESMDLAVNYHRWIMDVLRPYLGKDIVEVGAGTGGVSEMLLNEHPTSLTLIEPSGMFDELTRRIATTKGETKIVLKNDLFRNIAPEFAGKVDTMVYINVLEHIEDDEAELKAVFETL